jgi:hypothetical protein
MAGDQGGAGDHWQDSRRLRRHTIRRIAMDQRAHRARTCRRAAGRQIGRSIETRRF